MCRIQGCDPWDLYHAEQRTARKPHKCTECGRVISKGERYHYASGLAEGRFDTFKMCEHCDAASDWLTEVCNGYIYGDIGEELEEHWEEDTTFRSRELAEAIIGRKWAWRYPHSGRLMPVPRRLKLVAQLVMAPIHERERVSREVWQVKYDQNLPGKRRWAA
jgi:hypothetical protein